MGKPLKIAGIFGIIILALTILSAIISLSTIFLAFNSVKSGGGIEALQQQTKIILNITTILLLIIYPLSIGFLYGFVNLGKRFNNKMLSVTAWTLIILTILGFISTIGFYVTGNLYPESQNAQTDSSFGNILKQKVNQTPVMGAILNIFGDAGFWPLLILFVIVGLALKLTFGLGIYQLKKKDVALAGWVGSFEIGSIIINSFEILTILLGTIMFFKASKKFE